MGQKFIITEQDREHIKTLYEQSMGGFFSPQAHSELSTEAVKFVVNNPHQALPVLGVVAAFVPVIGPALSTIIGVVDAGIYAKEGKYEEAGLALLLETIPLWGPGAKMAFNITKDAAKLLARKVVGKQALNEFEQKIIEWIGKNTESVKNAFNEWIGKAAKESGIATETLVKMEKIGAKVGQVGQVAAKTGAEIAAAETVASKYSQLYQDVVGASLPSVQKWFLSSKDYNDNKLLEKALASGWKPGQPVPEQYQTQSYKEDIANLNNLDYTELDNFIKQFNNTKTNDKV